MEKLRTLRIGIKTDKGFFAELKTLAGRIDDGRQPGQLDGLLYFDDLPTLPKHPTSERIMILAKLRQMGHLDIASISKQQHRQRADVLNDVGAMEILGLIEHDSDGLLFVPWDEIVVTHLIEPCPLN